METESLPCSTLRVAWLLPIMMGHYWQPVLREFAKLLPNSIAFTGEWPGFIPGYEETFKVRVLPGYRRINLKRGVTNLDIGYEGYQWVTPSVVGELRRFRPDVLFTSAFGLWTACALAYRLLTRSRVIVLLDGISQTTTYMGPGFRMPIRRIMGKLVDAAVCNSQAGCGYLRDVVAIPASKVAQLPFYVPDAAILRSGAKKKIFCRDSRTTFLFIGQFIERKGWGYLLDAVSLLVGTGFNAFSVKMIGDGPQKQQLLERILFLGLQDVVSVVGAVPYNQLGTYFEAGDVLVFPSMEDTWGMVVSEAMAFGKAVLCSQFAGSKELVHDGTNGYVFNPRNPSELAGYMRRFLLNPGLIVKFGDRSREIIASHTPELAAKNLGRLACRAACKQDAPSGVLS